VPATFSPATAGAGLRLDDASARGLERVVLKRRKDDGRRVDVRVVASPALLATPTLPLALTIVAGAEGICGTHAFAPAACATTESGTALRCR
jgi:hypothetical protein